MREDEGDGDGFARDAFARGNLVELRNEGDKAGATGLARSLFRRQT